MITWYSQELSTSCVAACVRMVLADFNLHLTEKQIRKSLAHTALGLSLKTACHRLQEARASATVHNDWNLNDLRDALRQGFYPIVGVERHVLGYPSASHAIVLTEIRSNMVKALDPLDGPNAKEFGIPAFELAWQLGGQQSLLIESPPVNI